MTYGDFPINAPRYRGFLVHVAPSIVGSSGGFVGYCADSFGTAGQTSVFTSEPAATEEIKKAIDAICEREIEEIASPAARAGKQERGWP